MYVCVCVRACVHECLRVYVCVYVRMYVCMCIFVNLSVCLYARVSVKEIYIQKINACNRHRAYCTVYLFMIM